MTNSSLVEELRLLSAMQVESRAEFVRSVRSRLLDQPEGLGLVSPGQRLATPWELGHDNMPALEGRASWADFFG